MKTRLFKLAELARLKEAIRNSEEPLEDYSIEVDDNETNEGIWPSSGIEVLESPPTLFLQSSRLSLADAELRNATLVWEYLPNLKPRQAVDERLWAYLCHYKFQDYVGQRWPVSGNLEKRKRHIHTHWFVGGGKAGLRRNAISRLWWAAHLTHRLWEESPSLEFLQKEDDWHYLMVLVSSQDLFQALIERSYGGSGIVRALVLDVFSEFQPELANTGAFVKRFTKEINLIHGWKNPLGIDVPLFHSELKRTGSRILNELH